MSSITLPSRAARQFSVAAVALVLTLAGPRQAMSHSLGTFAVDRTLTARVGPEGLGVELDLLLGEGPTMAETERLDADENGRVSDEERGTWERALGERLAADVSAGLGGSSLQLTRAGFATEFPLGPAGLPELRVRARFASPWPPDMAAQPPDEIALEVRDAGFQDVVGLRRVLVFGEPRGSVRYRILDGDDGRPAGAALRYQPPAGGLASSETAATTPSDAPAVEPPRTATESGAAELVSALRERSLTAWLFVSALGLAFLLGALHALSPGHGKTLVAAYLIGGRGTVKHAIQLGLTVTFTHVVSVLVLGLILLPITEYALPQDAVKWLGVASGAIVAAMGVWLFVRRLSGHHGHGHGHGHEHEHGHSHGHEHEHPVRLREILALGVSGGLLPCPTALVVLLVALAVGRLAFGLLLITTFSLGLATVLVVIGVLVVKARGFATRWSGAGRALAILALISPLLVAGIGVTIALGALGLWG